MTPTHDVLCQALEAAADVIAAGKVAEVELDWTETEDDREQRLNVTVRRDAWRYVPADQVPG